MPARDSGGTKSGRYMSGNQAIGSPRPTKEMTATVVHAIGSARAGPNRTIVVPRGRSTALGRTAMAEPP
jgi:hypothetical protein